MTRSIDSGEQSRAARLGITALDLISPGLGLLRLGQWRAGGWAMLAPFTLIGLIALGLGDFPITDYGFVLLALTLLAIGTVADACGGRYRKLEWHGSLMPDLFSAPATPDAPVMPDADVRLIAGFAMPQGSRAIFDQLRAETAWRQEKVHVWGKWHDQPRLVAWHGDPGRDYVYARTRMVASPWTELLLSLKRAVEAAAGSRFNSVLLNLYRDEKDRMGFHSDDEPALGQHPTIASLSYGATRTLIFRHRKRRDLGRYKVPLTDGSLLVMGGPTQACWAHGIDRETRACGPRINLTFREIKG